MGLLVQIVLVLTILEGVLGYMVFAPKGTCENQQAYGAIAMQKYNCDRFGGAWNDSPDWDEWIDCYTDLCKVPQSGAVSSEWAWAIDMDQRSTSTSDSRIYAIVSMQRKDCDQMRGRYNSNPEYTDWIKCHLFFTRVDGTDRRHIKGIVFCGINECSNKVAYGHMLMKHRDCSYIKGGWNDDDGANDWEDCHLDIVISPVIDCIPSDSWMSIHTCSNDVTNSTFDCSYQQTTGIQTGTTTSSTTGGYVEISVTAQVSAELKGIFTASTSTTFTTGFHWENTVSNSKIWSEATTKSFTMKVPPGKTYVINQVVGKCNDYRINTSHFKLTETNGRIISEYDRI